MPEYKLIDGFKCYAPELANENGDFDSESFDYLYSIENTNFWFVSRNIVIKSLVKKYVSEQITKKTKFLEIGCGTGYVLKGLSEFSFLELEGAEIYLNGLKYARTRLPGINLIQLDATKLPFKNEFSAIGAFDVLEHISEDELVIEKIYDALKIGCYFFISVPQFMWMWSRTDDYACHKRRYNKKELLKKLRAKGFKIEYVTSFMFTLFPLMILSRLFSGREKIVMGNSNKKAPELNLNPLLNSILKFIMKLDELLIGCKVSLPFGGSLIVVAKKLNRDEY